MMQESGDENEQPAGLFLASQRGGFCMQASALVLAAGRGQRMGAGRNKLLLPLAGEPILSHTLSLFEGIPEIGQVVLVIAMQDEPALQPILRERGTKLPLRLVYGGSERMESVWRGLQMVACPYVLVHDGARPLTPLRLIHDLLVKVVETEAVIPAVPVKETIKQVNDSGVIIHTPAREQLWVAQTPQAFRTERLVQAYAQALKTGSLFTDDASVVEWTGYPVAVVRGDEENIKLTIPQDLRLAEWILQQRRGAADEDRNRI